MRRGGRGHSSPCAGAEPLPKVTPGQILAGGGTARRGGVSLGHPSHCWGSFIMEEPLMEGKPSPSQGMQNPPYPLPRELGG